jgi:hypothetical protein
VLFRLRLFCVGLVATGFLLTINDSNASYVIICYNIRAYRSTGVVAVTRGKHQAELAVKKFEDAQNSSEREEALIRSGTVRSAGGEYATCNDASTAS